MFDTMTLTKVVGGVCGALLIFLFGNWAANSIYGFGEGGHDEEARAGLFGRRAPRPRARPPAAEGAAEPAFAEVFAAADAAAGEKVFGKCKACHKIDGKDGTGPHLNGVVGRNHGVGRRVSNIPTRCWPLSAEPWTEEAIYDVPQEPQGLYLPGTKMGFAGLPKPEDRANVIAYLATLK